MRTVLLGLVLSFSVFAICTTTICTVCPSGCDYTTVQAALDNIPNPRTKPQVIELTAGATYAESITLRSQTTNGYPVVIRSNKTYALSPSNRIVPATDATNMAKILAPINLSAMQADEGASYYEFDGVEFATASGTNGYYILMFGNQRNNAGWFTDNEVSKLQHHIWFNRCWIHGINAGTNGNFTACINAGTGMFHLENSVISDCFNMGNKEAHAFQAVNGTGPFYFTNTQFSASQIGTLFGGSDPSIRGLIATGIFITGNYYYRPWLWRVNLTQPADPVGTCNYDANGGESYNQTGGAHAGTWWLCVGGTWINQGAGTSPQTPGLVKNHMEFKNAYAIRADGNYLTNGWYPNDQNQKGSCFLINQVDNWVSAGTHSPWAVIAHAHLNNNWCAKAPTFTAGGQVGDFYYNDIADIDFSNNIASQLGDVGLMRGSAGQSAPSIMAQTEPGTGRQMWTQNTLVFAANSQGATSLNEFVAREEQVWSNNIVSFGDGAVVGGYVDTTNSQGFLGTAISTNWPIRAMSKNVVINDNHCIRYGQSCAEINILDVLHLATIANLPCASCAVRQDYSDLLMTDWANGDYSLTAPSPYKGWGHYGIDPGADTQVVGWSTQGAVSGAQNPYLTFRVRNLGVTSTTAAYRYTAPSTEVCAITVAGNPAYSSPAYNASDSGGNPDRTITATGLTTKTRYWWKAVCGASNYRRSGILTTP